MGDAVSGLIGLLGALAGAYAAYRWGLKAAREAKQAGERERDVQLSFALLHKLNKIYGTHKEVRKQIECGQDRLDKKIGDHKGPIKGDDGSSYEPRFFLNLEVRPLANIPKQVTFSAEEVITGGRVGSQEALEILMVLDDRYNALLEMLALYRSLKQSSQTLLGDPTEFDGTYASYAWTEGQARKVEPVMAELDELLGSILKNVLEDEALTFKALRDILQGKANREDEAGPFLLPTPDGEKIVIQREKSDSK